MTIKQLEQQLEIPRATIRFYEKENLIHPKRNDNSYREYGNEDVAALKKIIILRKIGLSVADIKRVFDGECCLQSLLQKNILELEKQIKELEGAISVTKIMQERNEDIFSLDEDMYWTEIDELEKSGLKFREILNDIFEFEKGLVLNEFQLVNEEGKLLFSLKESVLRAMGSCVVCGLVWYFLEGQKRTMNDFLEGFFWPFMCILLYSILGLPIHFIGKKNPQFARRIKKIGMIIACAFTVALFVVAIFVSM